MKYLYIKRCCLLIFIFTICVLKTKFIFYRKNKIERKIQKSQQEKFISLKIQVQMGERGKNASVESFIRKLKKTLVI